MLQERSRLIAPAILLVVGAVASYLFGHYAYDVNSRFGFPLDDPWIHLQFAKNLHDFGSFSYFKKDMVTAGSTSPLYTFLLAIGFFVTSDEMVLSYVLGVAFLLVAALYVYKLLVLQTGARGIPVIALGGTLLFLIEMRMQWAALSGMETTLFIALLLAVVLYYREKKPIHLGIASGLLLWARPEAVIMMLAVALDAIYHGVWCPSQARKSKPKQKQQITAPSFSWMKRSAIILAGFAGLYAIFNLALSGSLLPNTFAAKLKYYGAGTRTGFPSQVFHFLIDGHMLVIAIGVAIALIGVFRHVIRREPQAQLVPLLFSIGMFFAFWLKLPYLYQEGRYMMPIIPFVLLLGMDGLNTVVEKLRTTFQSAGRRLVLVAQIVVLLVLAAQFGSATLKKRSDYAEMCGYINARQVRTAHWLREHTPPDAVIGTHDIGAIAFYSGRRIADMVGLVSPDMIERIGSLERLHQFLREKKVTHLAVLRNWFEVVNQTPLFKTNEREPEIMEVFAFKPGATHLTSQDVSRAVTAAGQYLYQGQPHVAVQILQRAGQIDPQNSKVRHLMAMLHLSEGRLEKAKEEFSSALQLYPDYVEAQIGLAQVLARENRADDAIARLEGVAQSHPDYPAVYRALADVYQYFKRDTARAHFNLERFNRLIQAQQGN